MTIDEAIAILTRHYILEQNVTRAELNEAGRLGIEALKRLQELRRVKYVTDFTLLPGETTEEGVT